MADFERLLDETSRTFALAIRLLPEPTRRDVTLAYLLFRLADTLEDGLARPKAQRKAALVDLARLLRNKNAVRSEIQISVDLSAAVTESPACSELVAQQGELLAAIDRSEPAVREMILTHAAKTAEQMAGFLAQATESGQLQLRTLDELRAYCYAVAGIVGELLTELFLYRSPTLGHVARELRSEAPFFGEGLQLVNILRDAEDDARDRRSYLPPEVDRQQLFQLAAADLAAADRYTATLLEANAPPGVVRFTKLPVVLARATLQAVEREGPGIKLDRQRVLRILQEVRGT